MDHGYFKDRLSAFIDQELTPEETKALSEHLEQCADCREQLARLKELDRLVEKHSELDGDEYFERSAQKIESRLGLTATTVTDIAGRTERNYKGLWWKTVSVAAAAVILVFIGVHRDDIFTTSDLKMPGEAAPERQRIAPADTDSAEPIRDVGEDKPASTVIEDLEPGEVVSENEGFGRGEEAVGEPAQEALHEVKDESGEIAIPKPVVDKAPQRAPEIEARLKAAGEEEAPPPPPAPTRVPPSAVTTAPVDEESSTISTDDNYKRPAGLEFGESDLGKSITVQGERRESITVEVEEADYLPSVESREHDVWYWINRRDSLVELVESEKSTAGRLKQALRPDRLTTGLAPMPTSEKPHEADLLEAWFWIAELSTDSVKIAESRAELERIAADTTSVNCDQASEYLRRLGNK